MVDPTILAGTRARGLRQYRVRGSIARTRQHGAAIIYLGVFALFALFGMVTIAVDIGKVRASKAQLSTAADAAACAGALALISGDTSDAEEAALQVASANVCQGSPVSLVGGQDIEYGLYRVNTRTYTPLGASEPNGNTVEESECNACRVIARRTAARGNQIPLTWLSVFRRNHSNAPAGKDILASATAFVRGGPSRFGIVGLDYVDFRGNNARVDSYDPALGSYENQIPRQNGSVASNGPINVHNGDIYGDARPGVNSVFTHGPNGGATGWTAPLDTPLDYPPAVLPGGTINLDAYKPANNATLQGGTLQSPLRYRATLFDTNKTLYINGAVELYVTGDVRIRGAAIVNQGLPANLKIFVIGAGTTVDMGGNNKLYAQIYAPQSAVTIHGTPGFYGALVGKSLDLRGTADIHYDESTPPLLVPYRSVLVK